MNQAIDKATIKQLYQDITRGFTEYLRDTQGRELTTMSKDYQTAFAQMRNYVVQEHFYLFSDSILDQFCDLCEQTKQA